MSPKNWLPKASGIVVLILAAAALLALLMVVAAGVYLARWPTSSPLATSSDVGNASSTPLSGASSPAQTTGVASGIRVQGYGWTIAKPDVAQVVMGATVVKPSVDQAIKEAADRMAAVDSYLVGAGVAEGDIQTEYFSVAQEPVYPTEIGPDGTPRMVFRANHQQRVSIRDISKVAQIVEGAVKAGANSVQSIQYVVRDSEPYLRQAREKAMEDAKAKAAQLAALSGVQLGPVVSVVEVSGQPPAPVGAEGKGGYFQPGTSTVSVSVEVTFSIR